MEYTAHITSLIPQREPFIMIDELMHADGRLTRTRLQVRPENIFVQNGVLTEPALLENIAQTAAAGAGYQSALENKPVQLGYIGAVRNFEVCELPATGEWLETEITLVNQVFDVSLVSGIIQCGTRIIARCDMKIFIKSP